MKAALIDVKEWQTMLDLRTGETVSPAHPLLTLASEVLRTHPYPGDMAPGGARWVTDVALEMNERYEPQFMLLVYANASFPAAYGSGEAGAAAGQQDVFAEIERFLACSGFAPVVVGLGDMVPVAGTIDTTPIEGLAIAGGMSVRFAGIDGATPRDLQRMSEHPGVERIIEREAFREQFGGSPAFYRRFPEHLLVAREGYIFRGVGAGGRVRHRVPAYDRQIPLHTALGEVASLVDVADLVLRGLTLGKTALILVEAVGCRTFPWPFRPISNALHWYTYGGDIAQYLALSTGRHLVEHPYPPAYRYYVDDGESKPYPFSGIVQELPADAIGERFNGRSVAVGSRGMLTHPIAGADVTIECFVRTLYNHGVMAVVDV